MDREKVIKGLECCSRSIDTDCSECPYNANGNFDVCGTLLADDALAMLKEHGKTGHWIYKKYDDMFMCSCCEKYSIRNDYPYCHWCGAKMEGGEVNDSD